MAKKQSSPTPPMPIVDAALEREYNNRALVPEHPVIFERWRREAAAYRARADAELDLRYGPAERHRMDLFRAPNSRGTVVFIHGGYWRSLDKSDFSFVAAAFVASGLSVAAFNYRLCPMVSVADIVTDCQEAFSWLLANGARHGVPIDRIVLTGHSAGGHLVAMLFATDWRARGIDPACILGGAALSAVSDLEPLLNCSMNDDLHLSDATARDVSPIHLACQLSVPLYLAAGADESAAFRGQSAKLHHAWPKACGMAVEIPDCNHFTIVDDFIRPQSTGFQFINGLFT